MSRAQRAACATSPTASIRLGWHWVTPVAYVDTSEMWLAGRGARLAVSLAGPYANVLLAGLAGLAALAARAAPAEPAAALRQFALSSSLLALVNLTPALELDGYYLLSDWLDRPNLRAEALAWPGRELLPALRRGDRRGLRGHAAEAAYLAANAGYLGLVAALAVRALRRWYGRGDGEARSAAPGQVAGRRS